MEVQPERCISISFEPTSKKKHRFAQKKSQNLCQFKYKPYLCTAFEKCTNMVAVVQLVRASDCGSECRGFESHLPPARKEENR